MFEKQSFNGSKADVGQPSPEQPDPMSISGNGSSGNSPPRSKKGDDASKKAPSPKKGLKRASTETDKFIAEGETYCNSLCKKVGQTKSFFRIKRGSLSLLCKRSCSLIPFAVRYSKGVPTFSDHRETSLTLQPQYSLAEMNLLLAPMIGQENSNAMIAFFSGEERRK